MPRPLTFLFSVLFVPAALVAQGRPFVVDQESPADAPPAFTTAAVGGPSEQVLSQTVTAGISGRLTEVDIPIGCADGTLVMEIRDVDGLGQPGPTVRHTETFPAAAVADPVTDTYRPLSLRGAPVRLSAGEAFAISLRNPTGSCGVWPGPIGNPYSGGSGWEDANDGPIVPLSLGTNRDDVPFKTVVASPPGRP